MRSDSGVSEVLSLSILTFGSQMVMAVATIQKAMGHKDIKMTMIYVDVAKPHIRE
jgi:site-specific recombinase XerD